MDPQPARRGRLFRKYLVAFALLVGTAVLAGGLVEAFFAYRDNKRSIVQIEQGKAGAAADAIDQRVGEIERAVASTVRPGQAAGRPGFERRRDDFLRLLRQVQAIAEVTYLDSTGREQVHVSRVALDSVAPGPDRSKDTAFVATRGAKPDDFREFFGPVTFRNASEPYMTIAVGEPAPQSGAILADVSLSFVGDVLAHVRVGTAGQAYAVDRNGELILHSDATLVLRRTNMKSLPQVRAALAGSHPDVAGVDPQGKKVLSASQPIGVLGWHVFVEQPLSEAFAPLRRAINRTVWLLAAGLALAIASSYVFARRMTTPIKKLQEGAARIAEGHLDQRIDVRTGDEVESLAEEFNRMTAQLRESYAGLEQKVQDRTQDLGDALAQLEQKSRELETVSKHKSEFLANMSHELRTPLNAIIGFSEVLHEKMFGELNPRQIEYVDDILSAGQHLLALINDILDLSKVEAGRMELEISPVAIADTLSSGVSMHRERATRHAISVSLEVDPDVGLVDADERKVRQVVFNLLSNAVKFTPDGGRIDVRARRMDGVVEVSVADTGAGISPDDADRVFEEFRQASTGTPAATEGTGLGLALSRRFVELHGGRIWFESTPGSGATFFFTLPIDPGR